MPRRLEDIIPGDRRSIRDIPLPSRQRPTAERASRRARADDKEEEVPLHRIRVTPPPPKKAPVRRPPRSGKKRGWLIALAGAVVLAAAAALASVFFARASFSIAPVTIPVSADATIVASSTTTPGYMAYRLLTASGSASTTAPATDGTPVSTKASGTIVIYNAYSAAAQRLIAGTRLANDSGLIYRITSSVVVPGYSSSKGATVPGSVSVGIVADQPGASYDISSSDPISDFRIVAWKGTPRYTAFYGRLRTSVTGGLVGAKKTVSAAALASTTAGLSAEISADLTAKLESLVPPGYLLYNGGIIARLSDPVIGDAGTGKASIAMTGTLYGAAFKQADLAAKLAGATAVSSFSPYGYTAPGLDKLSFTITNPSDFSPAKAGTIIARVKGAFQLVGIVPVDDIRAKLAGISLGETKSVLQSYSSVVDITRSSGELFPSWASAVPTQLSRISVTVSQP
ncbi:MAG: hypothetical protein KGI69_02635 [Patescibacteria group bacterium]|nr:hypothetical protein [Patescibacteria group bacterium]